MRKNLNRITQLCDFLKSYFVEGDFAYSAITSDASFRQYYRVISQSDVFILMDSPVDLLDNRPFLGLQQDFARSGLIVPKILAKDLNLGFVLMSDLGSTHLADCLNHSERVDYYQAVLDLLPTISKVQSSQWMKAYDTDFIRAEVTIFKEWLVENWLGISLTDSQLYHWHSLTELLIENILKQPQVTIHRDFHSRNIMKTDQGWAIIDFQDAVQGPVSYDAVSLLKDCYFTLPEDEFNALLNYNYRVMDNHNLLEGMSFDAYYKCFELTGLQRHLKAAGIFCRLLLRDNKPGYVANILPTVLYIQVVLKRDRKFQQLATWFDDEIIPVIKQKLETTP